MYLTSVQYGNPITDGTLTVESVVGNDITFNQPMGNTDPVTGYVGFVGRQGTNAVAIGANAAIAAQHPHSIVINSSGFGANSAGANTTVIHTLRTVSGGPVPGGFSPVYYNNVTGELIVVTTP
jgi:hypothetical protein